LFNNLHHKEQKEDNKNEQRIKINHQLASAGLFPVAIPHRGNVHQTVQLLSGPLADGFFILANVQKCFFTLVRNGTVPYLEATQSLQRLQKFVFESVAALEDAESFRHSLHRGQTAFVWLCSDYVFTFAFHR
jgi:hypothetical protein